VVIAELAEKGERYDPSNISRHRPHIQAPELTDELDRLARELEHEAAMAPVTVAIVYQQLLRGLRASRHGKPPTAAETVKIAETLRNMEGLDYKRQLLMAYMERRFTPENIAKEQEIAARQRGGMGYAPPLPDFEDEEI